MTWQPMHTWRAWMEKKEGPDKFAPVLVLLRGEIRVARRDWYTDAPDGLILVDPRDNELNYGIDVQADGWMPAPEAREAVTE